MSKATMEKKAEPRPPQRLEDVPQRLEDVQAWSGARAKLDEVRASLQAKRQELARLEQEHYCAEQGPGQRPPDQTEAAAMRLLDGKDAAPDARALRLEKLLALRREIPIVEAAERLQTQRVQAELQKASDAVCRSVLPEHRANVAELGDALLALARAQAKEQALRERLAADGVVQALFGYSGFLTADLVLRERNSPIRYWVKEQLEAGNLSPGHGLVEAIREADRELEAAAR